jgi:hypothetical protein
MLEEAIERLAEFGRNETLVQDVHEGTEKITKLVLTDDGYSVREFDRPEVTHNHQLEDLGSLQRFIGTEPATVFVNTGDVVADRNYGKHRQDRARMGLVKSDEWRALEACAQGVKQKELWRLLVSKLVGCCDESLLMYVRSVKITDDSQGKVEISTVGSVSAAAGRVIKVRMGAEEKDIPETWKFKVRVWDQMATSYDVDTRLEIDTESGKFIFHPIRLCDVYERALHDIEHELTRAGVTIYRGKQ